MCDICSLECDATHVIFEVKYSFWMKVLEQYTLLIFKVCIGHLHDYIIHDEIQKQTTWVSGTLAGLLFNGDNVYIFHLFFIFIFIYISRL